jgi:pimeloyl-ACP methyl ester carboxylesterase
MKRSKETRMEIISEKVDDGVVCRRFDLTVEGQAVPGLYWWPEAAGPGGLPTILFGHGGFQSKEAPNIVEMAAALARERGYASIALDAPGHGDRRTEEQVRQQEETLRRLREGTAGPATGARGGATPRPPATPDGTGTGEPRMVREWKALLDTLDGRDHAPGPYGYWGVSMGARYGIPLVAGEPRIAAAVLGLFGLLPDPGFRAAAGAISVPILFLFQFHDELMTPDAGLKLWDAFGSTEKTMHINPGPHVGIPTFERDSSAEFFARHLG